MNSAAEIKVLIVDDEEYVLETASQILSDKNYSVFICRDASQALNRMQDDSVDIVLTDIKMPGISGLDLLAKIREKNPLLPVILMTGYADLNLAVEAINRGAFNFIIKPYHPEYLLQIIKKAEQYNHFLKLKENYKLYLEDTVRQRTHELETAKKLSDSFSKDLVERLTTVAEFRDTEAGAHVARIGIFSELVARTLGLPMDFVHTIKLSSPLHDIGKIAISDSILLKPGPLTPEEFQIMKSHTTEGKRIVGGSSHPVLQMAESIAGTHHERWDGTGYPNGLRGGDIPLEGRIAMIVDQYDALRSERPYKPAFDHAKVVEIITEGDGRTMPEHFDSNVMNAFNEVSPRFDDIYTSFCI